MSQSKRRKSNNVVSIYGGPEVAVAVFSGGNINTVGGYVVVKSELTSSIFYHKIKQEAYQLAGIAAFAGGASHNLTISADIVWVISRIKPHRPELFD